MTRLRPAAAFGAAVRRAGARILCLGAELVPTFGEILVRIGVGIAVGVDIDVGVSIHGRFGAVDRKRARCQQDAGQKHRASLVQHAVPPFHFGGRSFQFTGILHPSANPRAMLLGWSPVGAPKPEMMNVA